MTVNNLLVVDDEDNIRHMLSLLLSKEGYAVETASDGAQAYEKIAAGEYDIVLCDVRMPELTGIELLEKLQANDISTTVIVMSAYGSIETAIEAMKAGAYDYLSKPFKRDEVLLTLRKVEERNRLRRENLELRDAAGRSFRFDNIIAKSQAMQRIFETIRKVADYPTTVLITGESGTGKELVARAIHHNSNRARKPFVAVNCGAIPETLLESELFGHVKGAFTDARSNKKGLFEEAGSGTLFLDEIGSLPLSLQVKLLRVLQENELRRVGDTKTIRVEARIVAANAKPLEELVAEGLFREDLLYRLHVMPIELPPLRDRLEDIPPLIRHFIQLINQRLDTEKTDFSPAAMKALMSHSWPGNVRELENTIERSMVMSDGPTIKLDALPSKIRDAEATVEALLAGDNLSIKLATKALERHLIERALRRTKGNRTHAAQILELSHRALLYKIKEYELSDIA